MTYEYDTQHQFPSCVTANVAIVNDFLLLPGVEFSLFCLLFMLQPHVF